MGHSFIRSADEHLGDGLTMDGRYFLIELPPNLGVNDKRKSYDAVHKNSGRQFDPQPSYITHGRTSLDGAKFIIEGVFSNAEIEKGVLADILAVELGLPMQTVFNTMTVTYFAPGEDWETSRQACVSYLIANKSEWEPVDEFSRIVR